MSKSHGRAAIPAPVVLCSRVGASMTQGLTLPGGGHVEQVLYRASLVREVGSGP